MNKLSIRSKSKTKEKVNRKENSQISFISLNKFYLFNV